MNEYGIKKIGSNKYLDGFKTEKDIFKLLKVEYLEPKDTFISYKLIFKIDFKIDKKSQ